MANPLSLENRRYLITGAASGIGKAAAIYLSKLGCNLLLADINEELLKLTCSQIRGSSMTCIDLTKTEQLKAGILSYVESNGKLNGFAHCAGLPYIAPLKAITGEKFLNVFRVNTQAALELSKIFANKKVYAGEHGSIVFISSIYGIVGSAANVGYAATKGAIQSMAKALAIELAPQKIRVNCIAPGFIKTEMSDKINHNFDADNSKHIESLHPLGWGSPDDIAA
ncbi:MAG: SDR family oxidoreductase, partial [Fibromonadales bacterium]|nr:SDR family oxidoreductase [Fibromonadales bacterium]